MSQRPEILFPLFAELAALDGVGPKTARLFAALDVEKPRDLLFLLPHSGISRIPVASLRELSLPAVATVEVAIGAHHPPPVKGRPYRISVRDAQIDFELVFFHANAAWLRQMLPSGQRRLVSGKVELFDGLLQMVHPDHILRPQEAARIPAFEPVYPLTAGLSRRLLVRAVAGALERLPELPEWIAPALLQQRRWPGWKAALRAAHAPQAPGDLAADAPARERLAYDELFAHQLTLALARNRDRRAPGLASTGTGALRDKVLESLPYEPTGAQLRALREIADDMAAPLRMNRLLQGDVGAGKTLVAFLALLIAVEAGGQGAMMAPTAILARQHLESLTPLARAAGVNIGLLTGQDRGAERSARLEAIASGRMQIVLGTHALFQEDVAFADLRLAIVDEQHRFGVRQRLDLGRKGRAADVLVMTATPIPRSLALAQYGDMDISVLDEKPPGRKPVRTVALPGSRLGEVVEHLRLALEKGRQAYWVCPLVNESETVEWTAAEERAKMLRRHLGEDAVGLVHGQMPPAQRDAAMRDFIAGRSRVLVATTVIEVGVDVPAASIMVIEQAEHFGLAQLHQLRGRVGRGEAASSCLLLYTPPLSESAERRLTIMRESDDGFRLAEEDLRLRGAGDLLGVQQSGLPRFRVADLERQGALQRMARDDARMLIGTDPELSGPRGQAARVLLYLMEQDRAIRLLSVG